MGKKVLTVVIPAYNVGNYLEEELPTFLDPRILNDIEVLIVNDGSKDNTFTIASKFEKKYPDTVHLINKENGGHGSTINKGIELANGKYFKVVDGDDWVETNDFVDLVLKLKNEDSDVVLTPFKRIWVEREMEENAELNGLDFFKQYKFIEIVEVLYESYQMHSITIKTNILRQIPQISGHCFYVDQEYCLYPVKYVNTIICYPYNVYRYRVGTEEQSMNKKNMQKNRAMHERVTLNLLNYYLNMQDEDGKKIFLQYRVGKMCEHQIAIILSLGASDGFKQELSGFLDEIKKKSLIIYNGIPGKKAWVLKKFGMKAYWVLAMIQQKRSNHENK